MDYPELVERAGYRRNPRLRKQGQSLDTIAKKVRVSRQTVANYS